MQSPRCPEYLAFFAPVLDECYRGEHRGTLVDGTDGVVNGNPVTHTATLNL